MRRKEKIRVILDRLKTSFPAPRTALVHRNPFELLVATILSAQTTDALVNKVTERLFRAYPTPGDFAAADLEELRREIASINFYRTKAKNIQGCAQRVLRDYGGRVPASMGELTTFPGVARKTANIVLWDGFGIAEGIAVDTHVKRLSRRLGLTIHDDPLKVERDLMKITPREEWGNISHYLIFHGRTVCNARHPRHGECVLADICPSRRT